MITKIQVKAAPKVPSPKPLLPEASSRLFDPQSILLQPLPKVPLPPLSGKLQDMIRYQSLVGDLHLKVELVSRISDSLLSTVRRLQQQ